MKKYYYLLASFLLSVPCLLSLHGTALATQITLAGLTGYGYNTIDGFGDGFDGQPGAIGCGPTSGAMVLDYYVSLTNPLADARAMTSPTYMNTDSDGFGSPKAFQLGLQDYAAFKGYDLDVTLRIDDYYTDVSAWGYPPGEIVNDMLYFNSDWSVDPTIFLNFVQSEIDAGNPIVVTVDSDGYGVVSDTGFYQGDDHWMVIAGYDLDAEQWAGYNTWDSSLHWYDVASAFHTGDTQTGGTWYGSQYWKYSGDLMGINVVRTFDFNGLIDDPGPDDPPVPEPTTMLLFGTGLVGLVGASRKRKKTQA